MSKIKKPGVYINEINALPNSVVPVATAIPAFIGYTPRVKFKQKSYKNIPQKITSFAEFKAIYCYSDLPKALDPAKQYSPEYYLVKQMSQPKKGDYVMIEGSYYLILPDPNTIYYLYNSIRLFFDNGGGAAYIVSVGTYGKPSKKPIKAGEQIVNQNVQLNALINGVASLKNEEEPTMYICPEATLLSLEDNGTLMQEMLLQNTEVQRAISIFDVIGGRNPDPILYTQDIANFRNNTGSIGLSYGAAYYPFIGTTIMNSSDVDFTNLFGGDISQLEQLINPAEKTNPALTKIFKDILNPSKRISVTQYHNALLSSSKNYSTIITALLKAINVMPPSAALAGVITTTDNQEGVWKAPANISIVGAVSLPIKLTDNQQEGLNVDPVSGKSINAIRFFNGQGILIWGARTLDGNSGDWRYLPVRRTLIFLETSCKMATRAYVFEPNDKNTWDSIKSAISNFLTDIWKAGGLQGASASDAFSVQCGLGTTMTTDDLENGILIVSVSVAVTHPAEFIVFSIEQQMATSDD
ncbi:phage tail sheath C-terminal domain-containing protein [Algoriphagus sp. SE2]|uniref:phage tail sheath family protein n=1 Tax=Algoriphagus sp. SE2 TaxID=3141536 RepID=UPI0031CD9B4D